MDKKKLAGILTLLAIPAAVWAGEVVLPYTFSSGTPIRASEMNANLSALKGAVDDLDSRLNVAGAGIYRSGSRLKLMTTGSNDGFTGPSAPLTVAGGSYLSPELFWDDELKTVCMNLSISHYGELVGKCVPPGVLGGSSAFSDSNCQSRVALVLPVDSTFVPDGESVRAYGAYLEADGGAVLFEKGVASATPLPTFRQSTNFTSLPDGGSAAVTTCDPAGSVTTAPIVRTFGASGLAPLTLNVRR